MSQPTTQSFEERLRARLNEGTGDVPIFTTNFERNHTMSNPGVIFQQPTQRKLGPQLETAVPHVQPSVLRGDPGRGQTPGFPHRIEEKPVLSFLYEEPTLVSFHSDTGVLVDHLQRLHELPEEKDVVPSPSFVADDAEAVVALAPLTWRPAVFVEPSLSQKLMHSFVRVMLIAVSLLLSMVSDVCVFFGWVISLHLLTFVKQHCLRILKKVSTIPSFSLSALLISGALFTDLESIVGRKLLAGIRAVLHAGTALFALLQKMKVKRKSGDKWKLVVRLSLPSFTLPKLSLPKLSVPKVSLPSIHIPAFSFPKGKKMLGGIGQLMVIASIVLFLMTGGPILRLQLGDWWQQSRVALTGKAAEPAIRQTLTDTVRKPDEVPPIDKQFQLEIPKIGANLRVIPNVDAGDEAAYTAALKLGVAHAAGSGLPGEPNLTNRTVYIFGHSTNAAWNIEKYNALFYSLKDMVVGDDISVWFWGKEFKYKVTNVIKIDPSDLTYLAPQTVKDQLILQTCWPPGTVWKRLLVIAEPVK